MAIFRPTLGPITQSFGNLTASKWKDKTVLKQKVPATNTSNSGLQQAQRRKFAGLAQVGGVIGSALRIGFKTSATSMTEQNVFQSKNKMAVVLDVDLVPTVLYEQLIISAGNVEPLIGFTASADGGGTAVAVTWTNNGNGAGALDDDEVTIVLIDRATNRAVVVPNYHTRYVRTGLKPIALSTGMTAANVQAYAFCKRTFSTATSPSVTDAV